MKFIRFKKLRSRFIYPTVFFTMVILLISNSIKYSIANIETKDEMNEKINTIVNLTKNSFGAAIFDFDTEKIENIMKSLLQDKNIFYIHLKTKDASIDEELTREIEESQIEVYQEKKLLSFSREIEYNGQELGTITIKMSTYYNDEALKRQLMINLSELFLIIGGIYLIILLISKYSLKPLMFFKENFEKVSDGDFNDFFGLLDFE